MKAKLIQITYFLLIFSGFTFSPDVNARQITFTAINPSPTGNDLSDIFTINATTAVAVGESGTFVKTTDNGQTWSSYPIPTDEDLNAVWFADTQNGWIAGDGAVLFHTSDGGETWEEQDSCSPYTLTDIHFINENTGWIAGNAGSICHTTDGGATWSSKNSEIPLTTILYSIFFIDENTGFIGGGTSSGNGAFSYKTTDGGESWSLASYPEYGFLYNIQALNENLVYAVHNGSQIVKSEDGGSSWTEISDTNVPDLISGLHMVDENTGFASGSGISKTTNGGETWQSVEDVDGVNLKVHINGNAGWVAGDDGLIFHTSDLGESWAAKGTNLTTSTILGVFLPDENSIWVATSKNAFRTNDNRATWETQEYRPQSMMVQDIVFVDEATAFVSASQGLIYKTTDNGQNWTSVNSMAGSTTLSSIYFLDENTGITGTFNTGTIRFTSDGGTNWATSTMDLSILFDLAMLSDSSWIAAGQSQNSNAVSVTHDAGETWNTSTFENSNEFRSIYVMNAQTAWVVGTNGQAYKTTDAGTNWQQKETPVTVALNDIHFADENNGIIVGMKGTVLTTSDGGESWVEHPKFTNTILHSVYMTDAETGIIGGAGGAIYLISSDDNTTSNENVAGNSIPKSFELGQNYPNPFNPSTMIPFTLKHSAKVKLQVFDILGREIATLVDQNLNAGLHNYAFNASEFSSGMYLYRLQVNNEVYTRKMTLLK